MHRKKGIALLLLALLGLLPGCMPKATAERYAAARNQSASVAQSRSGGTFTENREMHTATLHEAGEVTSLPWRIELNGLTFKHPERVHLQVLPAKAPEVTVLCEPSLAKGVHIAIADRLIRIDVTPEVLARAKIFDMTIRADYSALYMDGAFRARVDASDRPALVVESRGAIEGLLHKIAAANLSLTLADQSRWQLKGNLAEGRFSLTDESDLDGRYCPTERAEIRSADRATAALDVHQWLWTRLQGESRLAYRGQPEMALLNDPGASMLPLEDE